jgi:hypothetical protein
VLVVVTAVAVGAVLLALGTAPEGDGPAEVPVGSLGEVEGTWEAVDTGATPAALHGRLMLVLADVGLFVDTGCNSARGSARVEQERLVLDHPLAVTLKACPPPLDEQERWVLEMLDGRPRLARAGDRLVLSWGDGDGYRLELRPADGGSSSSPPSV